MWYSFLHLCCTNLGFLTPEKLFQQFREALRQLWNWEIVEIGMRSSEDTRWHSGYVSHSSVTTQFWSAPASVWDKASSKVAETKSKHNYGVPVICVFETLHYCLPSQNSLGVCLQCCPNRTTADPSDVTHSRFELSSWGMTSYQSHRHTEFQVWFYPGWQMNAVVPVVLPVSKLLSYSVCLV